MKEQEQINLFNNRERRVSVGARLGVNRMFSTVRHGNEEQKGKQIKPPLDDFRQYSDTFFFLSGYEWIELFAGKMVVIFVRCSLLIEGNVRELLSDGM